MTDIYELMQRRNKGMQGWINSFDSKEELIEEARAGLVTMFEGMRHHLPPGREEGLSKFHASIVQRLPGAVDNMLGVSVEEVEEERERVDLPCVGSNQPDRDLPTLAGSRARKEIESVVIGVDVDNVRLSMGVCDLVKSAEFIVTPVNNITMGVVNPVVDRPIVKMASVLLPSRDEDAEFVSRHYGRVKVNKKKKGRDRPVDDTPTCDRYLELAEHVYPRYRDGLDDAYYHLNDSGRYNRQDIEMHARDVALSRILDRMPDTTRIGILCYNEAHFERLYERYPGRVFYPVGGAAVDVVLVEPYGRALEYSEGMSMVEQVRAACVKYASGWQRVPSWILQVNNVKFTGGHADKKAYSMYLAAHHRPRFYVTNVAAKTSNVDMVFLPAGRKINKELVECVSEMLMDVTAFILAVSAARNYRITPATSPVIKRWADRCGDMPADQIYTKFKGNYLDLPVLISGRRVKGGKKKSVRDEMTSLMALRGRIGDDYVSYETLTGMGLSSTDVRRLVMVGTLGVVVHHGISMYYVPSPTVMIEWVIPPVPPTLMFNDVLIGNYDIPVVQILPVPLNLKSLLTAASGTVGVTPTCVLYTHGGEGRRKY